MSRYTGPPFMSHIQDFVRKELNYRATQRIQGKTPFIKVVPGFNFNDEKKPKYVLKAIQAIQGEIPSAYTFDDLYNSSRAFRPKAGITDATIEYKDVVGSTRKCTFNWICPTLQDLEDLSVYFMHPGMTCLIEWGWSHVAEKNVDTSDKYYGYNMANYYKKTQVIVEASKGNYDAMLGYIANYSCKLNNEGSFNCSTTVIGIGDKLQGMSLVNQYSIDPNATDAKPENNASLDKPFTLQSAFAAGVIEAIVNEYKLNKSKVINYIDLDGKDFGVEIYNPIYSIDNTDTTKLNEKQLAEHNSKNPTYLTWAFIEEEIINPYIKITDSNGIPLFKFNSRGCKTQFHYALRTIDLDTCIFPASSTGAQKADLKVDYMDTVLKADYEAEKESGPNPKKQNTYGKVRTILVNYEVVKSAIGSSKTVMDFVTALIAKINDASANFLELRIKSSEEIDSTNAQSYSVYSVIDSGYYDAQLSAVANDLYVLPAKAFDAIVDGVTTKQTGVVRKLEFSSKLSGEAALNTMYSAHNHRTVGNVRSKNQALYTGNQSLYNAYYLYDMLRRGAVGASDDFASGPYTIDVNKSKAAPDISTSETAKTKSDKSTKGVSGYSWQFKKFLPINTDGNTYLSEIAAAKEYVGEDLSRGIELMKALILGKGSPNQSSPANEPVIPLELEFELDGISGIRTGDMFTIDYLPRIYREKGVFQIKKISHTITKQAWIVKATASFRIQLDLALKEYVTPTVNTKSDRQTAVRRNAILDNNDNLIGWSQGYSYKFTQNGQSFEIDQGVRNAFDMANGKAICDSFKKSEKNSPIVINKSNAAFSNLQPSDEIINYLKAREGLNEPRVKVGNTYRLPERGEAPTDSMATIPKGDSAITIGYGYTNPSDSALRPGVIWPISKVNDQFWSDIQIRVTKIKDTLLSNCAEKNVTQNMFDALFSYYYNVGNINSWGILSAISKNTKEVAKALRGAPITSITTQVDENGNKTKVQIVLPGLVKRRLEESLIATGIQIL